MPWFHRLRDMRMSGASPRRRNAARLRYAHTPRRDRRVFVAIAGRARVTDTCAARQGASFAFTCATTASNAAGSWIAISDNDLRSSSIPVKCSP